MMIMMMSIRRFVLVRRRLGKNKMMRVLVMEVVFSGYTIYFDVFWFASYVACLFLPACGCNVPISMCK